VNPVQNTRHNDGRATVELTRRFQVIDASFVVSGHCRVDHVEVPGCVGELLMVG